MENNQNALKGAIEKLDVHDHLCLIYESREEQLAAVMPFMRIGLERGERCVYIADDNTVATVIEAMRAEGIDVDVALDSGALSVITKHETYLKEGRFDPEWMINFLKESAAVAKADGYSALRATGEMTWMLGGEPGVERLMEYEAKLNYFLPEYDCLAICQYNRERFSPKTIIDVIHTHPLVIYGYTVCRNADFIPPDEFLETIEQRPAAEAERLLAGMLERERIQTAFEESEQRFRNIFSHSPIAIEYYDANGLLVEANQAGIDLFGVEKLEDVKGFKLLEDPNIPADAIEQLKRGKFVKYASMFDFDLVRKHNLYKTSKTGKIFAECYIKSILQDNGTLAGYLVHVEDITERKRAVRELVEANQLLEAIFDHTHIMVALLDSQLIFIRVNRAYADADEKEPGFYPGKKHFDLFPNEENEDIFRRVVETGEPYFTNAKPFQFEENPERGVSYWDWSLVPIKDEGGAVASLILSLLNVTERVQSEEAIIRSEEKYRSLYEESRDGIIILLPEGRIEDINPAGAEMLGYSSAKEILQLGTTIDLYQRKEDRDIFIRTLMQQEFVKNYELALKRKNGELLTISVTVSASRDKSGKIVSYMGIMRDMTAHRLLEQQLMQAQKMESIGRLAGGIAHDFNNYLTAIHGYIDLAVMDLPDGSPAIEDLIEAGASSDRAANLSRQLLLFSRRENIDLKPVDLNRVISDLLKMLGRLIGEQYEINIELADDLRTVNADTSHLEQVLMNLAVNARDAMPDGGVINIKTENVVIEPGFVKAKQGKMQSEFVEMAISDSGVGMDDDIMSHVFEPFFSTKEAGKGTGLGLSVVYGIITQHGGWIDVESNPGKGTIFKIYFPALNITLVQMQEEKKPAATIDGYGEKILLVEDDDDIRKMINKSLVDHGYQVFQAADAETAVELFEQEEGGFDLCFSDVVLPGQDGVWLVNLLKERRPGLEVLLTSGYSDITDQQAISDRGYRLMRKPYSIPEVLMVIHEIVSR